MLSRKPFFSAIPFVFILASCGGGSDTTADGTWGVAELIESGGGDAVHPQIAFDGSGNAIAVWEECRGTCTAIYANRFE